MDDTRTDTGERTELLAGSGILTFAIACCAGAMLVVIAVALGAS